jgi:hypothetical protein
MGMKQISRDGLEMIKSRYYPRIYKQRLATMYLSAVE